MDDVVLANKPILFEPRIYSLLLDMHRWDAQPVVDRICAGDVGLLILVNRVDELPRQTIGGYSVWPASVIAAGLVLFSVGLGTAIGAHIEVAKTLQSGDVATRALLDRIAVDEALPEDNPRTLWAYGSTSQRYVLWFSDYSTDHVFQSDIARLCPRDSNLDIWKAQVFSSGGVNLLPNFTNWDVAIVPDKLAGKYPDGVPQGRIYPSDISAPPYGHLQFIVHQPT
jgi:hypothetical protein